MIKAQCIIDGNYLLMKNLFILKKLRALTDLEMLLNRDFDKISRSFPFENVYFVSDSRGSNWRKKLYKEYKGTRKKDSDIDWEYVFNTYDTFKESLKSKRNLKLLEFPGLEGDDFIAHIIHTSNKEKYSNILVASDGDLQQLMKFDLNDNYINIQWNYRFSDERVYLPENYQLFLDQLSNSKSDDIFTLNNDSDFGNYIENLLQKTKVKTVTSEQIVFEKIVQGDNSDNIPSICKVKNGKVDPEGRGIGEKGANSVYKLYKEINPEIIDLDSEKFVNNLIDVIFYYKKIKSPDQESIDIVRENIIFNRKLIKLDSKYMPESVSESMISHYDLIENEVKIYEEVDLEKKLEDDGFFDEKTTDIDENFRKDESKSDAEEFNIDDYWEI